MRHCTRKPAGHEDKIMGTPSTRCALIEKRRRTPCPIKLSALSVRTSEARGDGLRGARRGDAAASPPQTPRFTSRKGFTATRRFARSSLSLRCTRPQHDMIVAASCGGDAGTGRAGGADLQVGGRTRRQEPVTCAVNTGRAARSQRRPQRRGLGRRRSPRRAARKRHQCPPSPADGPRRR